MYLLLDIGGTKTRIAGSVDLQSFTEPLVLQTEQVYEEAIAAIGDAAAQISGGIALRGVVVGTPGNKNLPQWRGRDLAADLKATLYADVHIENDAALVGLGEAVYGAGKGASICVYYTVSTGVNGVRIVEGKIDTNRQGFEVGGQYLQMGESPKTLEDLVSGTAVAVRFGVSSPRDLGADHPVWEELARTLAIGVHNSILHWSPDRVVIGGSMMNEIGISVPRVAEHVASMMQKFKTVPEIVHSSLGDVGGIWGGMARLRQQDA